MKKQNSFVFAFKCIYIFAASFALTESIFWKFVENKIGFPAASTIVLLAAALHLTRSSSMILTKALDLDFELKGYVNWVLFIGLIITQVFVLAIEGVHALDKPFQLISAWIVANALSITISCLLAEKN
jgi:hypothetical protein